MDLQKIKDFVAQLGFPVFVSLWLMYDKLYMQKELVEALNQLKVVIERMN